MSSKKWDDADLVRVSAELDAELEEIFAEVDRVQRRPSPESKLPRAEIRPEDFEGEPRKTAPYRFAAPDDPPEIEILPDDFGPEEDDAVGDFSQISPAANSEVFDADFTVEAESRRSAGPGGVSPAPRREPASRPAPSRAVPEPDDDDDNPVFLPKTLNAPYGDFQTASVGDMSPDDFGRLIERAVERAILSAIAKAGL